MHLKQKMVFDVVARPEGMALILRDTPPWGTIVIFFKENEDGSLVVTNIIEEQGPPVSYGITHDLKTLLRDSRKEVR